MREIVGILSVFLGTSIPEYPTPSRRMCLQILPPKPGVFLGTSIPRLGGGRDFESGGGGGSNDRKLTCICGGSGLSATAGFDSLEIRSQLGLCGVNLVFSRVWLIDHKFLDGPRSPFQACTCRRVLP